MKLDDVNRGITKHKRRKRVGRGGGSGHGKTSGRGHKGQGALAGWTAAGIFEGGSSPLIRRIPKRGFHNQFAKIVAIVNLGDLNDAFEDGADVTPEALRAKNLAKGRYDELKVLANGELKRRLKVSAHRFSQSAIEKIKQAGGEAIVLSGKAPVVKFQKRSKPKAKPDKQKSRA